jgi:hypothetical protein
LKTKKSAVKLNINNSKNSESIKIINNQKFTNYNIKDDKAKIFNFNKKTNSHNTSIIGGYLKRIETIDEVRVYFVSILTRKYSLELFGILTVLNHFLITAKKVF